MRGEGGPRWQPVDRGNKRGDQGQRREVRRAPRSRRPDTSSGDNPLSALEAWSQRQAAKTAEQVQNQSVAPRRGERRVPPRLRGQQTQETQQDPNGYEAWRARRDAQAARKAERASKIPSYSRPERIQPVTPTRERPGSQTIERATRSIDQRDQRRGPSQEHLRKQEVQRRRDIAEARHLIDRQEGYKRTAEQAMYPLQQRLSAERDLTRRQGLERLIYARQKIVEEADRQIQEQEDRLRQLGAA